MKRHDAVREITEAGATPVETGAFLRFKVGNGKPKSFFPNHYENMKRGEVREVCKQEASAAPSSVVGRRVPKEQST